MTDCLFCKIIEGGIPGDIVYRDDEILAFRDANPQAPTHLLVVPRKHIATINDVQAHEADLVGRLFLTAQTLAGQENLAARGYRLVFNCNEEAGQSVFHIHLHLLGGRRFSWPPG